MSQEKSAITRKQILGARALLEITQEDLAAAIGISDRALYMIETGNAQPRRSTLAKLRAELERRGIEFINGTGVKLKDPAQDGTPQHESAGR